MFEAFKKQLAGGNENAVTEKDEKEMKMKENYLHNWLVRMSIKFSIETLLTEINPVVPEKGEVEDRVDLKILAKLVFLRYQISGARIKKLSL